MAGVLPPVYLTKAIAVQKKDALVGKAEAEEVHRRQRQLCCPANSRASIRMAKAIQSQRRQLRSNSVIYTEDRVETKSLHGAWSSTIGKYLEASKVTKRARSKFPEYLQRSQNDEADWRRQNPQGVAWVGTHIRDIITSSAK